jgi:hypothetical protein
MNVTMKKYFVGGLLEGMTVEDKMSFISWNAACRWAGLVTQNNKVDYVVLEMTNVETGQVCKF